MLTFLAFLLRNEYRITTVEEGLKTRTMVSNMQEKRLDRLEDKNS
jgi:hypothetical protein